MTRAIIITYYWPPAGGPGVQRWLKFVKYFREFGIEPLVFVPKNPSYPLVDENFSAEIPPDIEIIKFPINEPYRWARLFSKKKTRQMSSGIMPKKKPSFLERLLLFIRGNLFIPDARVGWVRPSVKFLKRYVAQNPVDVIITTGPPHSLHLIGMQLQKKMDIKWIADFRDPWTTIHYHKSLRLTQASEKKHKLLEAEVLNSADRIVVTSPSTKKEFSALTPKPITVITNGHDLAEAGHTTVDASFSISHIGSLLSERNPVLLWRVLSEISNADTSFRADLQLNFAGAVSGEVEESLRQHGLLDHCFFLGYVPHAKAVALQRKSQLLLLVEMDRQETRAIIPGKLFEYLAARRPILAIGPAGSDMEGIIQETGAGKFFTYNEEARMKEELLQLYRKYKTGKLQVQAQGIEKYSRRALTESMASVIKDLQK